MLFRLRLSTNLNDGVEVGAEVVEAAAHVHRNVWQKTLETVLDHGYVLRLARLYAAHGEARQIYRILVEHRLQLVLLTCCKFDMLLYDIFSVI